MSRDDTVQRHPEWNPNRHQGNRHHAQEITTLHMPQTFEPSQQRTLPQTHANPGTQHAHGQTVYSAHDGQNPTPADHQPYLAMQAPVSTGKLPGPPEVQPRRRVSADQLYTAHKEARVEARQALKEEAHTEGLLKSRKAVLPSEIRRRERSVDDPHRGHAEDMVLQNYTPERRRISRGEDDWDGDRQRERGRERNIERLRERGRDPHFSHDSQEERAYKSMQPSHLSVQQQSRQPQTTNTEYHPEHPMQHQHPEIGNRQQAAPADQQVSKRQHQHDHWREPQEPQTRQLQQQQENDLQRQKTHPDSKQQESQPNEELDHPSQRQDAPEQQSSAVYIQKGSSLPQAKGRSAEVSGGPKPKPRTRSMSDIGISQHSAMYHMERMASRRETSRAVPPSGTVNGEMGTLDTRVSVAQLRHSYLENANRKPEL